MNFLKPRILVLFLAFFAVILFYKTGVATVIKLPPSVKFGPVPIKWGEYTCVKCHMKILKKNENFATEIGNPETREIYTFDSPGCAVAWLYVINKFSWASDAKIWVMDSVTHEWIDAKKAYWRAGFSDADPMHYGLVASKIKSNDSFDWEKAKSILINAIKKRMEQMKMKMKNSENK